MYQRNHRNWQADPNMQAFLAKTTLVEKQMAKFHVRIEYIVMEGGPSSELSVDVHACEIVLKAMTLPDAAKQDPGVPRRTESSTNIPLL